MFPARRSIILLVTILAALALPAHAGAWDSSATKATNITTPSGAINAFWNYNSDVGTGPISVSGIVTSGYTNPSYVRIGCLRAAADTDPAFLSPVLTVNSGDQSFSTTVTAKALADYAGANWQEAPKNCALRAIPVTSVGAIESNAPYASSSGPRMAVSTIGSDASGDIQGLVSKANGGFLLGPAGGNDGGATGRVLAPIESNGYSTITFDSGRAIGATTQVDGQQVWLTGAITGAARSAAGFQGITYSEGYNDSDGSKLDMVEPLLKCISGATTGSGGILTGCTGGLASSGVMLERLYTVNDGNVFVLDTFYATGPHTLSLAYSDRISFNTSPSDIEFVSPNGGPKFKPAAYPNQTVIDGPALPNVGTFMADDSTAADGATDAARAALTYAPSPSNAWVVPGGIVSFYTNILLSSAQPAVIKATLSQAQSQAVLGGLAADAQIALSGTAPLPTLTPPATGGGGTGGGGGGAVLAKPSIVASGKAKVTRDKKTKLAVITTGRSLICPTACSVTAKLTATYKVKKKKKTVTFATATVSGAAGSTTPIILKLTKKSDKLFTKLKKLKFTVTVIGAATGTSTATLKAPKPAKKKK